MAPKSEQMSHVLGINCSTFRRVCHPLLQHLAATMDEVKWSSRLHPMNHTPIWPYYVTHIKDTFCVPVADSHIRIFSSLLYSTKYHTAGLKCEVTCDFRGHIADSKFPAGTAQAPDYTIHNERVQNGEIVLLPWEYGLADGAYRGCTQLIAKYPIDFNNLYNPATRSHSVYVPLTYEQELLTAMVSHDRQRIEHIVGFVTYHDLFQKKYRGEYSQLRDAVHLTMNMTNVKIRMFAVNATDANGRSRYSDTIGPWQHDLPG